MEEDAAALGLSDTGLALEGMARHMGAGHGAEGAIPARGRRPPVTLTALVAAGRQVAVTCPQERYHTLC